jgi:hypothetical protein
MGAKRKLNDELFFAIPSFYFLLALHCRPDLSLYYTIIKNNKHEENFS